MLAEVMLASYGSHLVWRVELPTCRVALVAEEVVQVNCGSPPVLTKMALIPLGRSRHRGHPWQKAP